jgi:curved DNA-binding protein CbpA
MSSTSQKPLAPEVADHYFDLGLDQNATPQEIKTAYFALVKRHHPDRMGTSESVDAIEFRKVSCQVMKFQL